MGDKDTEASQPIVEDLCCNEIHREARIIAAFHWWGTLDIRSL